MKAISMSPRSGQRTAPNSAGVFHVTLTMPKHSKGIKYLFRALVPTQTGWASQAVSSSPVTRLIG